MSPITSFRHEVRAVFGITVPEAEALVACAATHYDARVLATSSVVFSDWHKRAINQVSIEASSREIDTALKALEIRQYANVCAIEPATTLWMGLGRAFKATSNEWRRCSESCPLKEE